MTDKKADATKLEAPGTLTDDQIVTERKIQRRSFLSATGAVLTGAAGIVSGARAASRGSSYTPSHNPQSQNDPDQKKPTDPDQKKAGDPDQKKASDPDQKRASDPDQKSSDPDKKKETKKKANDPDQAPH